MALRCLGNPGRIKLREIMMDTITVDDFDPHELRAASFYDKPQAQQPREAA
ncbi:hypothetical protein [Xanthomonas euvesicatoria]|uniref:hypothetical protein n=1 Tax=Xanthomonas euvesicatoria TaxID=456327 RepID=UPI0038912171